jgi:hemerythrin-like domain-containing protein
MAELTMNQVIHAAVRRDVARTEQALRALREDDRVRAEQVRQGWAHLVGQLRHHHESEDALVWPYLRSVGVDEALLDAMEAEHAAMTEALSTATEAVDRVVDQPTRAVADAAADAVAQTAEVVDRHLEHEEREAEPLVMARGEDPAWKAVEKQLRPRRISDAGASLAWMQDGAGSRELAALRATIPPPVLFVITKVFGRGYQRDIAPIWRTG